eukprot:TRINITY_DN8383_c0_g1_i1.p1 TRINITY_DN8383_c0_g1~~TRINITY_DN8383_c0_g1_i1.p1  ORF type:complete len:305 (+),score=54.39 TRINITY_DN8383_c0_g1_i1:109-915(+)
MQEVTCPNTPPLLVAERELRTASRTSTGKFSIARETTVSSVSTVSWLEDGASSDSEEDDCFSASPAAYSLVGKTRSAPAGSTSKYPSDLVVRNTFLDFASSDESSAASQRRSRSAEPVLSRQIAADSSVETERLDGSRTSCSTSSAPQQSMSPSRKEAGVLVSRANPIEIPLLILGRGDLDGLLATPTVVPTVVAVMPEQVLGTALLPTLGSAGHDIGECKPCAFFWKDNGCVNGMYCQFCHKCDAAEKKKRQKVKKALFKTQTEAAE